ncbi:sensor histidine kinase [Desulfobacter latus]|uniref:histidine kinase n=1 Tax=Desulfobacter latus TaxID=2292 RepID=A0A850T7T8_9BACT|nr:HAMP domain-containing sensor histidine kinase [Desulfobacter latus]NWH05165.1 HAMP domain-containing histidine kinase [Desulfobacter latus]
MDDSNSKQDELTRLVRMMIHDLEKPIMVSHWMLDRIERGKIDPRLDRDSQMVRSSMHAMARAGRMVSDLKEIMSTKQLPVHWSRFGASELLKDLSGVFRQFAEAEEIDFQCLDNVMATIESDEDLVFRILENYLYNALVHTDPGGRIVLETRVDNGTIRFLVFNGGNHIPEASLERIFEPEIQLELRRKKQWRGQGLGLAFCKLAAGVLDARVGVENVYQPEGVQFSLSLNIEITRRYINGQYE